MPFYSGLASPLLSLMPTATRGGGEDPGNTGNIITGFIFDREITTILTSLEEILHFIRAERLQRLH